MREFGDMAMTKVLVNSHDSVVDSAVIGVPSGLGTGEEEILTAEEAVARRSEVNR